MGNRPLSLVIALALLLCAAGAHAQGLLAQSPADAATIPFDGQRFVFTTNASEQDATIANCSLIVDEEVITTIGINAPLRTQVRQFTGNFEPGTYQWAISCRTAAGETLTTQPRLLTILGREENVVTVTSSGTTRGSLLHSFSLKDTTAQRPVAVPDISPGDYVSVGVEVPPSTITKEFYFRGRTSTNGKEFVRLVGDDRKEYDLAQGENFTLPVGSTSVIALYSELTGTHVTVVFFPAVQGNQAGAAANGTETPPGQMPDENATQPPVTPPAPAGDANETAATPPPAQEPPSTGMGAQNTSNSSAQGTQPGEPEQGFFSRLLSLLAKIFGA